MNCNAMINRKFAVMPVGFPILEIPFRVARPIAGGDNDGPITITDG